VREIKNTNRLIKKETEYYYKYATGMKTGFTAEAKICIAASAKKDDVSAIALLFGADGQGYDDCAAMFDFVLENYQGQSVAKKGDIVAQTVVVNTRRNNKLILKTDAGVSVLRKKGEGEHKVTYKDTLPKEISAPIKMNQVVGTRDYYIGKDKICTVNLIADKDYALDPISFIVNKMIAFVTSPWLFLFIILAVIAYVFVERRRRRIKRLKRREERENRRKMMEEEIGKM
jgi:D-alanyl-D-alanine carboxypeptidase (penicillin-binding protein 5/6)